VQTDTATVEVDAAAGRANTEAVEVDTAAVRVHRGVELDVSTGRSNGSRHTRADQRHSRGGSLAQSGESARLSRERETPDE
jgi:hypothetical protein